MTMQWIAQDTGTPIVELRRYRLRPGRRDELIALFEREFVTPQDELGARVLGTFTLVDQPDQFFWLRGFADMARRQAALDGFYSGPVWSRHGAAANATMLDSDDVHLTRAISPAGGLRLGDLMRHPGQGYTLLLSELRFAEMVGNFHLWLRLHLRKAGREPLASFATLPAVNNFPRLPVWQDRTVHAVLLTGHDSLPDLPPELRAMLRKPAEPLRLLPTSRSLLR